MFDGIIDLALDGFCHVHSQRLGGIGDGCDGPCGGIQRRNHQQGIHADAVELSFEHVRVHIAELLECRRFRVFQKWHHDAGLVDHGYLLGFLFSHHHDQ